MQFPFLPPPANEFAGQNEHNRGGIEISSPKPAAPKKTIRWWILFLATVAATYFGLGIFVGWFSTHGFGNAGFFEMIVFALPVAFACGMVGVVGLCWAISRKQRWIGLAAVPILFTAWIAVLMFEIQLIHIARKPGLISCMRRAEPILAAIRSYEKDKGEPPWKLEDFVPSYLSEMPYSGLGKLNIYHFHPDLYPPVPPKASRTSTRVWAISVGTPLGILNWDQLRYHSDETYPKEGYGGWLEPMGKWAYVHE